MQKIKDLFSGRVKFFTIPTLLLLGLFFLPITICLLLGWLIYTKVGNKQLKFTGLVFISLITLFFGSAYIAAFISPTPPKKPPVAEIQPISIPTIVGKQIEIIPTLTLVPTLSQIPSPTLAANRTVAKVTRVIDGDTIEIDYNQRVRYIGMDTPEKDTCFFNESTNKNKELVEGKTVSLEKDVSETDRYDRLLRYVYVGDTLINEVLVKEGYAQILTVPPDVKYQEKFLTAQKEARDNNRGFWSGCPPQSSVKTIQLSSIPTVKPTVKTVITQPSSGGSCQYSCSSPDRDCADFSTHTQAQAFFNCCGFTANYDPMKLDSVGIGDGIACESLP